MSIPPSRSSAFVSAPMTDLIDILLRQFKRPLESQGVSLTAEEISTTAQQVADRAPLSEKALVICKGLIAAIAESEAWLAARDLTFERSLQTEMGDMPGWETTAEFLDLANEKTNAELRIAAGSALVTVLGDLRYVPYLYFLIENPTLDDVSAVMARRVLAFISETEASAADDDWLARVKAWADQQTPPTQG